MSAFSRFLNLLNRHRKPAAESDLTPAQAATLEHAALMVEGKAVPEPAAPARSTTASRRHEAAKRDRRNTTAVPTAYGLNRAQRRALGLHKVGR